MAAAISNQQKALIHVARGQLHLADEDYRALLLRVAQVHSSADLDEPRFEAVMAEFERLGFRHVRSQTPGRRPGKATPAQLGRIRSLWKAYSGEDDETQLNRWLAKKFHLSHIRFLEDWRAGKVVAILEKMAAWSRAKRSENGDPKPGGTSRDQGLAP
jgi:phage gp16-like protein